ncbi:MAG TPA: DUF3788 family protein [Candidatus Limnocylindrales bacterium]
MAARSEPPGAAELAEKLASAGSLWSRLQAEIREAYAPVTERWVYGGSRYGWSCRLEQGKKGILYMTPDVEHFRVVMALNDTAREAVLAGGVPSEIRDALASAAKAIEGWPVRMPVWTADDVAIVLKLAEIKLAG